MRELNKKIIEWAKEREIDKKGTVERQSIKTAEEISELIKGICKNDIDLIKDSIGDVYVTLVIGNMLSIQLDLEEYYNDVREALRTDIIEEKEAEILCLLDVSRDILENGYFEDQIFDSMGNLMAMAYIYDLDFKDCVEFAYNEISNRKGKMIDGQFVKESDLT